MKKEYVFIVLLSLFFSAIGCSDNYPKTGSEIEEENPTPPHENEIPSDNVIGVWELVGFRTVKSLDTIICEPSECSYCYILDLKPNGTFIGRTSTNDLSGKYIAVDHKEKQGLFFFEEWTTSKVNELGDGHIYADCLLKANKYIRYENELLLFYTDNDYLLFKQIAIY